MTPRGGCGILFGMFDGAHTFAGQEVTERRLFRCILRYGTIEKQDQDLTSNQTVLDIGTKARNREFHENLQAIHEKVAVVQHRVSPCINFSEREREMIICLRSA